MTKTEAWGRYDPSRVEPPTWLVEDLLPERATACMYGAPNLGKSFVAIDWALAIATGRPALAGHKRTRIDVGRAKAPGKVVLFPAEGVFGLNRRISGWLQHNGIPTQEGEEILHDRLFMPPGECRFDHPADFETLMRGIERECKDLDLLILDPLASFMSGDENATQDMQLIVNAMRRCVDRFGCSVLVVHHGGKSAYSSERGSSALRGGVDALFNLFRDPKTRVLQIKTDKQREAEKHAPIPINLHRVPELGPDNEPIRTEKGFIVYLSRVPMIDAHALQVQEAKHAAMEHKAQADETAALADEDDEMQPPAQKIDSRVQRTRDRARLILEHLTEEGLREGEDWHASLPAIVARFADRAKTESGWKRSSVERTLEVLLSSGHVEEGPRQDDNKRTFRATGLPLEE
ncbi:hypothetical protein WV31_10465 [Magnetospirillum sp. ME-1]|uniref:AAA family ATPase n=1 Tax=Magnetospirillum sp. ME-1 TaxID=1639348 RepID=UPI000A17B378|nr:AAA family ATPase [Magnetospirillum sp. ME-1]ARJ66050.1 hypothetical protein WV31_10465 [Magnetospirillum sp. ME-1]